MKKAKGTRDFLPSEVKNWRYLEEAFRTIAKTYGFEEIRTPTFEPTSLFQRGVGESTDIVRKEMFNVISRANMDKYCEGTFHLSEKGLTLKPEGTACIVRSFIENKMYALAQPTKLCYLSSFFRNERPQAGRYREFTQFGIEVLGSPSPDTDAEVIAFAYDFLKKVGVKDCSIRLNSMGCPQCRPAYHQVLKEFLQDKLEHLCVDCHQRFETNPLRILDCKNPTCQSHIKEHPVLLDYLCDDCKTHFHQTKHSLDMFEVPYEVDTSIVRGLDYYTKTAFEITSKDLGAQSSLCGGGRYDSLVEQLGGPATEGVGFGMGIDRLYMIVEKQNLFPGRSQREGTMILSMSADAKDASLHLLHKLRKEGIATEFDPLNRSFRAGMKYADKRNFRFLAILGEDEIKNQKITLKDLQEGSQITGTFEQILVHMEGKDE